MPEATTMAYYTLAFLLTCASAARLTRLITQDVYPPAAWARTKWQHLFKPGSSWALLVTCPYCASLYVVAAIGAWGLLTGFQTAWWVANATLGATYLAAIVVAYDGE